MSLKGIVLLATNLAQKVVGAKAHITAKSSVRLIVVHSVIRDDASGPNQESAVISFVQAVVLDQSNQIVW